MSRGCWINLNCCD